MSLHVSGAGGPLGVLLSLAVLAGGCSQPTPKIPQGKDGGPLPAEVAISGHRDVVVGEDASLTPVFIYRDPPIKLCFDSELNASSWQVWATIKGAKKATVSLTKPGPRLGDVTCFLAPLPSEHDAQLPLEICWQVYDSYEETLFDRECRPLRYRPDDPTYGGFLEQYGRIEAQKGLESDQLLRLAQTVEEHGYPAFGVRLRFVVVDRLRRLGDLAKAHRQLNALPAWLNAPQAAALASRAEQHRAKLDLAESKLQSAWRHLELADRLMRPTVPSWRFSIAYEQSIILSQVGALAEATERLEEPLRGCNDTNPCKDSLEAVAKSQLYWMHALKLDAGQQELAEVERGMEEILPKLLEYSTSDAEEKANHHINLAYFRVLRGHDPSPDLARARQLLAIGAARDDPSARNLQLLAWTDLVEGLGAAATGDVRRALELCSHATRFEDDPHLAAWSTSCAGRAHRLLGDSAAALRAFERALVLHEYATAEGLQQQIDQGPGQRGEDYYRAARAAADLGEYGAALEILERLDRFSTDEQLRLDCRERAITAEHRAQWKRNDERRSEIVRQLSEKEKAVSGERKEALDESVRQLKLELQELWRELPGCPDLLPAAASPVPPGVGWRIAALSDEILLFHRSAGGEVSLTRRPIDRRDLRRRVERIGEALASRQMSDEQWRELARPLGEALIPPRPKRLNAQTHFALHGFLQGVPLAALPVEEGEEARWLADFTTPILEPASRGVPRPVSPRATSLRGLFVVDPKSNLASTPKQTEFYRQALPQAVILRGPRATVEALESHLPSASFLHLDAHALFDPIFPELSSIEFADRRLRLGELADLPAPPIFANLSGCGTGRWQTTADAGRFGIAGAFARRGTHWVIASRDVIRDQLLEDFNRAFYRRGGSVGMRAEAIPDLYATALRRIRESYPATEWASLILLSGGKKTAGEGAGRYFSDSSVIRSGAPRPRLAKFLERSR